MGLDFDADFYEVLQQAGIVPRCWVCGGPVENILRVKNRSPFEAQTIYQHKIICHGKEENEHLTVSEYATISMRSEMILRMTVPPQIQRGEAFLPQLNADDPRLWLVSKDWTDRPPGRGLEPLLRRHHGQVLEAGLRRVLIDKMWGHLHNFDLVGNVLFQADGSVFILAYPYNGVAFPLPCEVCHQWLCPHQHAHVVLPELPAATGTMTQSAELLHYLQGSLTKAQAALPAELFLNQGARMAIQRSSLSTQTFTPLYELLAQVPSQSEPDKSYEIRRSKKDGEVYCTCPAWTKNISRPCKHLKALQPLVRQHGQGLPNAPRANGCSHVEVDLIDACHEYGAIYRCCGCGEEFVVS